MRLPRILRVCRTRAARRSDPDVAIPGGLLLVLHAAVCCGTPRGAGAICANIRCELAIGGRRRGALLTATVACGCLVLCSPALLAGEALVTAPDAVVRSAPFEVAPELLRVHAGDKLTADDRAQGTWRRVTLPDGRFGLVHDADVKVTVGATSPSPPSPRSPPSPTSRPPAAPCATATEPAAMVVLPASGRGVWTPIVQYARELLVMELSRRVPVIDYDRPPVAVQLDPHAMASVAACVGGRLAVAVDVSREAGVTTLDVTCYDVATAAPMCHARESTAAGPEVLPMLTQAVAARAFPGLGIRADRPPGATLPPATLPPHTFRLGVRALVMVSVVTAGGDAKAMSGLGLTATVNVRFVFADLLADLCGGDSGRYTLGLGAGFYSLLSDGARAPFVGASVHWADQHFGGRGASGAQVRPTVGFTWWRHEFVQGRVDLSYFIDLFEERTLDRLIAGNDRTYRSHGPMVALEWAF